MALTAAQVTGARNRAVNAARLCYNNRAAVHYTQGAARWDGINKQMHANKGQYPKYADCSSFATWCIWNGLQPPGVPDVVNGQQWKAGYTGTMLNHGIVVSAASAQPGDCVLYGPRGSNGSHTAICVTAGPVPTVISHGSEAGPYLLAYNYRGDVMSIRRYITGAAPSTKPPPAKPATPPKMHVDWFGKGHNAKVPDVKVWQQRMKARGWKLAADGEFGPESDKVARQFQKDKAPKAGAVDGRVGPKTWNLAWTAPVT
jgi:hypothetical protein